MSGAKRQGVLHRVTLGWLPLPWAVGYEVGFGLAALAVGCQWDMRWGLVVAQEGTLRHRGCSGGRMETQLQSRWQGGLRNRRNLPCLMLGRKHGASCQRQPPSCSRASPGAGRGGSLSLGRAHAHPGPAVPPGSSAGSPAGRAEHAFVPLCQPGLPINPGQSTAGLQLGRARRGCSCAASRRGGFSPRSSVDALPAALTGMRCRPAEGNTALAAAGGPGMQETQSHLARASGLNSVPYWGHRGRAQALFTHGRHSLQDVLPPHFSG